MTAPKVYAVLVFAPRWWPVPTAPNGNRQVRAVAAVPSRAAFGRLLETHGVGLSSGELRDFATITANGAEVAAALSEPGTLFHADGDVGRTFTRAQTNRP